MQVFVCHVFDKFFDQFSGRPEADLRGEGSGGAGAEPPQLMSKSKFFIGRVVDAQRWPAVVGYDCGTICIIMFHHF